MDIIYSATALKQLKKIGKKDLPKIKRKIIFLQSQPQSGKLLKGQLSGRYTLRAWPLRIIYQFDTLDQTLTIHTIDYRGNVYKN